MSLQRQIVTAISAACLSAAWFQGFRVSGFQGFRVSGFQGFRVSGFQGFRVSGFQGFRGSKVNECLGEKRSMNAYEGEKQVNGCL